MLVNFGYVMFILPPRDIFKFVCATLAMGIESKGSFTSREAIISFAQSELINYQLKPCQIHFRMKLKPKAL